VAKKKRNYRKEYDNYQGTEEQKKNRAERNAARRKLAKEGKVHKGDGKDVDHKKPLSKGGSNSRSNLRVQSKGANRSFARTRSGAIKKK
jgi:5-methylcytosine-specific restriction endonuclease McrA